MNCSDSIYSQYNQKGDEYMNCVDDVKDIVDVKFDVDVASRVLELMEEHDSPQEKIEKVEKKLRQHRNQYAALKEGAMNGFDATKSVVPLKEGWYAVLCISSKGEKTIKLYPFKKEEADILSLKPSKDRHLTQENVETLAPALLDEETVLLYEKKVQDYAYMLLSEMGEELYSKAEETYKMGPSTHACKRWVQRRKGMRDEIKAETYVKENLSEVQEEIMELFYTSKQVWDDETGIKYWLSEDNVVFIVGGNTIITLYEKDFGFSPTINRLIIFAQLQVIEKSREELQEVEERHYRETEAIEEIISQYNSEIKTLEAKIKEIKESKNVLEKQKRVLCRQREVASRTFNEQVNKLFRKEKSD